MAIDTAEKRRCVGGNMPTPDGVISIFDRRHIAGNYRGMPIPVSLGGGLTPSGAISRIVTRYRGLGGTLTPSATLNVLVIPTPFTGGLTFTGALVPVPIWVQILGGELDLSGALAGSNPAWLLIDDTLTWMGEWSITWSYDIDDVILYKSADGNEWHVFVSKIGHNVGNVPVSVAAAWRRLYQEKWL